MVRIHLVLLVLVLVRIVLRKCLMYLLGLYSHLLELLLRKH